MVELKGFVSGAYSARSLNADAQSCINWYPEVVESGFGKSSSMLVPTPGMEYFSEVGRAGSGAGRAGGICVTSEGRCFVVSGADVSEVLSDGSFAYIGALLTTSGPVCMAENGTVLLIVDGANYYVLNLSSTTLTTFTDVSLTGSTHVVSLGGFLLVNCPFDSNGVGIFRWSPLLWNGTDAWEALDYAAEDGSPDNIQGMVVSGDVVWMIGSTSLAAWYLAGGLDLPFARSPGTATQIGTAAKYSIAEISGSAFWLGAGKEGNGQIFRTQGLQAVRISTHAIENEIAGYSGIDDAIGFTYQQEGHLFYVLTFQTGDRTWVYDLSTGLWHERRYRDPVTAIEGRWRPLAAALFDNSVVVNDYLYNLGYGTLFKLNLSQYEDDITTSTTATVVRRRTSPHVHAGLNRVKYGTFQVDMETGVGLTTGQGSNPLLMLTYSNDGGHTYGNQRTTSIGAIGQYKARARFPRCGMARDRVWSIVISDPVKAIVLGAWMDIEVMSG